MILKCKECWSLIPESKHIFIMALLLLKEWVFDSSLVLKKNLYVTKNLIPGAYNPTFSEFWLVALASDSKLGEDCTIWLTYRRRDVQTHSQGWASEIFSPMWFYCRVSIVLCRSHHYKLTIPKNNKTTCHTTLFVFKGPWTASISEK